MKLVFALLMGLFLLSGCATKAYRSVERECAPAAFSDYPENKMQVIENRQRIVNISTGLRSCFTTKDGNQIHTICSPITRSELVSYPEMVVIDQNEAVRRMAIESCAANLCMQRYGNAQCKTDQLWVPVPSPAPAQ